MEYIFSIHSDLLTTKAGVEQADERTWLSVPVPVDRQRRDWFERRAGGGAGLVSDAPSVCR